MTMSPKSPYYMAKRLNPSSSLLSFASRWSSKKPLRSRSVRQEKRASLLARPVKVMMTMRSLKRKRKKRSKMSVTGLQPTVGRAWVTVPMARAT